MTTTPAAGNEPTRPHVDGPLALSEPGNDHQPLTQTQKILTGIVVGAVLIIATLGFIGSYNAVTKLATNKGFGDFAQAFPIAVDAGIIAFLALDLLLTWRRIPFPLLRYTAWGLTTATIGFNAAASWPDKLGASMHGVIPILFVIAVEAARHAIGRIADITADRYMEGPPVSRWLLNPIGTFILWRRQRLWHIRTWDEVLDLEQGRRIYKGQLRKQHGRRWRRKASADQLLVLRLTKDGMSVTEAIELPQKEAEKQRAEQARIEREAQEAANKRRREEDEYKKEQQRLEDERLQKLEDERLEREAKALRLEQERKETERQQAIADAEAEERLAEIQRRKQEADAAAQRRQQQEQLDLARRIADEKDRAAKAEELARQAADKKLESTKLAADLMSRVGASTPATASHHRASANPTPASARVTAASQAANRVSVTANIGAAEAASATPGTASRTASTASANAASQTATSAPAANASANPTGASASNSAATSAGSVDISQVVAVFDVLKQQLGAAPSDAKLGQALGVSRSRAQQLRTAAIDAGHTELAKPLRLAS